MTAPADTSVHPKQEALRRFLRGDVSLEEVQRIVPHLLERCAVCLGRLKAMKDEAKASTTHAFALPPAVRASDDRGASFASIARRVSCAGERLEEERERARRRLDLVHPGSPGTPSSAADLEPLIEDEENHTWGMVEVLLEECKRTSSEVPRRATQLAEAAIEIAERLDLERYGPERVKELLARACCSLGSSQRIRSLLREAEISFQEAKYQLSEGTDDPLLRAHILQNEASVYGEQGRYDRAFGLLDQVARIARRFDDRHLQGKAVVNKGLFLSYAQDLEEALKHLYKAIDLIDEEREPRLLLVAWHNIVLCLSFLGRNEEALEKLPYVRELHEERGSTLDRIRLHWIEGRIAADLGQLGRAERTLEEARRQLIDAGIGHDAAVVSLELANLYLRQGRGDRVRRLAEEMLPIFKSRDVHREAIAALIVFHKAVEKETVNLGLVQELEQYLRKARTDPNLRFQPST